MPVCFCLQRCALEAKYGGYNVFGLRNSACHVLPKDEESDLDSNLFIKPASGCMGTGYGAVMALDVYMLGNGLYIYFRDLC